ncbi:MAG TPA: acyl carrier protein [Gemmatimonadaceae bacterium]|nr:acyl carrier protein [Gemmatimonadaceae bacterium]
MSADIQGTVKSFILERFLPGENPANLTPTTPLISGGILDSLATLELVSYLEQAFGIQLEAHEVDTERLDTLERIASVVAAKRPAA